MNELPKNPCSCPACGSHMVFELCWVDVNSVEDNVMDSGAEGRPTLWCKGCNTHPESLLGGDEADDEAVTQVSTRALPERPKCAHTACSQHYIDTGSNECVVRADIASKCNEISKASRRPGAPRIEIGSSRETLIDWLAWCDPNGVYTDLDMIADDMDPMTLDDCWERVTELAEDA